MHYKKVFFLSLLSLVIGGIPFFAFAKGSAYKTQKVVTVAADEIIDGDYFAAGDRVEISGTVQGDVYAAGGEVLIDGTVEGDVLAAGGTVRITGTVNDDVRIVGGQLSVSGSVGDNVTVAGGNIEFTGDAFINGNIVTAGGNIAVGSRVAGDVTAAGGNLVISNEIGGKVSTQIETLRLTSKAGIGEGLTYWSPQEASIDQGARLGGEVIRNEIARKQVSSGKIAGAFAGAGLVVHFLALVAFLIVGLLIVHFFPKFTEHAAEVLRKKAWACLGIGLVVLIVMPIAAVILMATVVGIPLGLLMFVGYIVLTYVAKFVPMMLVGRMLLKKTNTKWMFVLGAVVYYIVVLIPFVGGLIAFVSLLGGMGAWVMAKRDMYGKLREKSII